MCEIVSRCLPGNLPAVGGCFSSQLAMPPKDRVYELI
jgi:hypothetical protein